MEIGHLILFAADYDPSLTMIYWIGVYPGHLMLVIDIGMLVETLSSSVECTWSPPDHEDAYHES